MSHYIGDVEISAITNIDSSQEREEEEIQFIGSDEPVIVEHEEDLEALDIEAALTKMLHSNDASVDEQREDLKALVHRRAASNSFDSLDWTGHISVESVDLPRSGSQANLISATIAAQYLPDGEYKRGLKGVATDIANDFSLERTGVVALPNSVTNVQLRNPKTTDTVSLSSFASEAFEDGGVDYYRLFGFWLAQEESGDGTNVLNRSFAGLQSHQLTTDGNSVSTTANIASGQYILKARINFSASTDEATLSIDNTSTTVSPDSSGTHIVESNEIIVSDGANVSLDVAKASGGTLDIDSFWLEPVNWTPEILFELPLSDFSVADRQDPVRVYDTNGSTNEADWTRVQDDSHNFSGLPVLDNGVVRLSYDTVGDFIIEGYQGGSYTPLVTNIEHEDSDGNEGFGPDTVYLTEFTSEKVVMAYETIGRINSVEVHRGKPTIKFNRTDNYRTRFSNVFADGFAAAPEASEIARHNNGPRVDDQYVVASNNVDPFLIGVSRDTNHGDITLHSSDHIHAPVAASSEPDNTIWFSAIPFSEISNIHIEAESADTSKTSGTYIDHWHMALNHPDGKRELHADKQNFTLDDTNGVLEHTNDALDEVFLHALDFGATISGNNYRQQVVASDTTGSEYARLLWCWTDTNNHYQAVLDYTNGAVEIAKVDGGTRTVINSAAFTFTYGTVNYNVEVEFAPSTGTIDLYVWDSANAKPTSSTVSATDSTYSEGQVGYAAYGSVDLHDWSVDAEESSSADNSAVIVETNSLSGTNSNVQYELTIGTDIPKGTYLAAIRAKDTLGTTASSVTMSTQNETDNVNLAVDGGGTFKNVESELAYDYNFVIREFRMDSDDDSDTLSAAMFNTESTNAGHIAIDEFILIPVSLQAGGGDIGPQDIAHEALTDVDVEPILRERDDL